MHMIPQDKQQSSEISELNSMLDPALVYLMVGASYIMNVTFLKEKNNSYLYDRR